KYSNTVDAHLDCNQYMMDEFKKGRIAINNNNNAAKDLAAQNIKAKWDKIVAACVIHYLNDALDSFSDDAIRNHTLSEALGFTLSLKYNPDKAISTADLNTVLSLFGNNFYTISSTNVVAAKDLISTIYDLDAVKDLL
ncbi:MAG TPA: DUF4856 domain-containing protein, partial [Flavobacteriales bacterium]|nr:DUF4856 domain-containing protein [Flavobacteriales bacterium]